MYVCMYVCMYVYMYVCMYAFMFYADACNIGMRIRMSRSFQVHIVYTHLLGVVVQ